MQAALLSLVVAASTVWLALDASKRDWTDNSFARNVPSWVIGSLLLWPVVFPLYVFVARKKAPLRNAPEPAPAVAMAAAEPAEQYGPSVEDVEPEPVVEVESEPVVEVAPEPVVDVVHEPEPEPEPVVEIVREPSAEAQPEPMIAMEPEPFAAPQALAEAEPAVEPEPVAEIQRESVIEVAPIQPEPVADVAPVEPQPASEPEPVLEISYPDMPADDAPPGLSIDAFKDIKPVAFGGVVVEEGEPASPAEPETEPAVAPESAVEVAPEPIVEPEPEPALAEPEPTVAAPAVVAEPKPKKRGFRLPNPEIKLPSFGKKEPAAPDKPKAKAGRGLKLPQIALPPNLQGALTDLERKIVLGSVVAIVAAGAFGYATAPTEDAAAPAPTPAPAAPSR